MRRRVTTVVMPTTTPPTIVICCGDIGASDGALAGGAFGCAYCATAVCKHITKTATQEQRCTHDISISLSYIDAKDR
jgi:hypothetical protein